MKNQHYSNRIVFSCHKIVFRITTLPVYIRFSFQYDKFFSFSDLANQILDLYMYVFAWKLMTSTKPQRAVGIIEKYLRFRKTHY